MQGILVNLVQLGFLGFAVAIMYLAFKLLQELVKNQGQNAQTLKLKMISVIFFLGLSAAVLCLGIWFSFNDPNREISITLDLVPEEDEMLSIIRFKAGEQSQPFKGVNTLMVKNKARITVDILKLRDEFNRLIDEAERNQTRAEGLRVQNTTLLDSTLATPDPEEILSNDEQGI